MRTRLISYFLGVNESHLVKRPVKVSYDKYRCREVVLISTFKESKFKQELIPPGGDSAYERGGDARRKF